MADFPQIYSTGPGAIWPGTEFTKGVLDANLSRGVITAFRTTGVDSASDAAAQALTMFSTTYPGDAGVPLRAVTVKLLGLGQALFIGYYGKSGSGQFVRRLQIVPSERRTTKTYYYPAGTENRLEPDPATGIPLLVPRQVFISQFRITWSDVLYQDTGPNLRLSTMGTINSNTYNIEGYSFGAGYLRFEGLSVAYEKWGAYDRWYLQAEAIYDSAKWQEGVLTNIDTSPGTPAPANLYPDDSYTSWPSIP